MTDPGWQNYLDIIERAKLDLLAADRQRIRDLEAALVKCWHMGQTYGGIREVVERVIPDARNRPMYP